MKNSLIYLLVFLPYICFAQIGHPSHSPGGEGCGLLFIGNAAPSNANSMYYNPSLIAPLHKYTNSSLHLNYYLNTTYQNTTYENNPLHNASLAWSSPLYNLPINIGLGYSYTYIKNKGDYWVDGNKYYGTVEAINTLHLLSLSMQFYDILSIGFNQKQFSVKHENYSYQWFDDAVFSKGYSADLGYNIAYPIQMPKIDIEITPSFSNSWKNIYQSHVEGKSDNRVYHKERFESLSFEINLGDYLRFTYVRDYEFSREQVEVIKGVSAYRDEEKFAKMYPLSIEQIFTSTHPQHTSNGFIFRITPFFNYGYGFNTNVNGGRSDFHGFAFIFDLKDFYSFKNRIESKNYFLRQNDKIKSGSTKPLNVFGVKYLRNIRFSITFHRRGYFTHSDFDKIGFNFSM